MKKLLTILLLIMLIISTFQITKMYALYKEQLEGEYTTLTGAWEIKVNEADLTSSGQVEEFTIADNQLGYVNSEYIQADKIAPGGQAYFDIIIDPLNTDVSIIYKVELLQNETLPANFEMIDAENYFKKDGETDQITNETELKETISYTSVIPVTRINEGYKNYIRIYFKWLNDENNNETDTNLAITENAKLSVPLKITLQQYTGEVIGNGT